MNASFYRRPLPAPLIPFSSEPGRRLFREALAAGTMEGYFPLAEQFHTQAEPAFCGLGTLVLVLNALAIDPGRAWRGPWRWYSEELLDCCQPLDVVRREGLTLEDFVCLARCNGAAVDLRRPPAASLADLRRELLGTAAAPAGRHLVVAYDRGALGQTGAGHYSPLAGYHEGSDSALLLDVARFKYPPYWVPLPLLYDALRPIDPTTGRPRGFVLLGRAATTGGVLGCVSCRARPYEEVRACLLRALPAVLEGGAPASLAELVARLLRALPVEVVELVELSLEERAAAEPPHQALLHEALSALRGLPLHALVEEALAGPAADAPAPRRWLEGRSAPALRATLVLLLLPEPALSLLPPALREPFAALRATEAMAPALRAEVERLRGQLAALEQRCCAA